MTLALVDRTDLQLEAETTFLIPPDKLMVTRGPCLVWRDLNLR